MLADANILSFPPFSFQGVTARVFPLWADMDFMTSFCHSYLNVAPKEVCEFHPYAPFVLLVVIDYGRMATKEVNLGWVSQHEVFFAMPLGKWRRERGRRVFQGWVLNAPFMVVTNPSSLTGGREIYGWPKVLAVTQDDPEPWLDNPRNPIRFLTLGVRGLDSDAPAPRLLDIDQALDQNPSLVPPNIGMVDLFGRLSRLNRASWLVGSALAEVLLRVPVSGFGPQRAGERAQVLFDSLRNLSGFYERPGLDVVNLKQFRDAAEPAQICYQAIVQSRLSVNLYNSGGMLGLYNLMQGDITGGYFIRLMESPAFPIIESFGLEVARQEWTPEGRRISILEPFFPFWLNVDLTYGRGRNLCWRLRGSPWYQQKRNRVYVFPEKSDQTPYNTFAGAAEQEWYGPFLVPDASFEVFPLRVQGARLRGFIEDNLKLRDIAAQADEPFSFELLGEHVYLIASWSRTFSKARSLVSIEASQVSFHVPLRFRRREGAPQIVVAVPFAFVDNPILAMTMREVRGLPARDATIEAPSRFLRQEGPLLTLKADVFTELDAGMELSQQTLLEIVLPSSAPLAPGSQPLASSDAFDAKRGPLVVDQLTLKEFGDAEKPRRACYQALVLEPWSLYRPKRITPLEGQATIRIYRYAGLPLVDELGLRTTATQVPPGPTGPIVDVLTPENPFRVEMKIEIGLGEVLTHTAGCLPWMSAGTPKVRHRPAGMRLEELLAGSDPDGSGLQPLLRSILGLGDGAGGKSGKAEEGDGERRGGD